MFISSLLFSCSGFLPFHFAKQWQLEIHTGGFTLSVARVSLWLWYPANAITKAELLYSVQGLTEEKLTIASVVLSIPAVLHSQ